MHLKTLAVSSLLALTVAMPASAQFAKPEDAIKYRKSALFVMQQNFFGRVAAMASGRIPYDAKLAASSAEAAAYVSRLPWAGFTPDSDLGDTKAKPEVWSKRARFDELAKQISVELDKLAVVSKSGKPEALKPAVAATEKACKNCHVDYRSR